MTGCDHEHAHDHGLSGGGLAHALAEAERRCGAGGERLTDSRRRVLELLLTAGAPVKAYDLMARFGGQGGEAAKPPTVYRALEFLERAGFIHRIAGLNAYIACSHGQEVHAACFLICDCCGAAQEFGRAPVDWAKSAATEAGYTLDRVTVEAHGLCGDCRSA